jgi:hypothetical protein
VGTNVSEENTSSTFYTEVSQVAKVAGYVDVVRKKQAI